MIGNITAGVYGVGVAPVISSYESIATTTLGSNTSSITLTSGGTWTNYKHLQLRGIIRTNRSAVEDQVKMQFNSDNSTNYSWHWLIGDGSSASAQNGTSTASPWTIESAGNTATSGSFGAFVIDILDINSTSKNKTIRSLTGYDGNGNGTVVLASNLWFKTPEAITTISIYPVYGSQFLTYTQLALYGIKDS
jgi:hypothetical protein